jgi:tetratricopeptide (TPR) repeat protein
LFLSTSGDVYATVGTFPKQLSQAVESQRTEVQRYDWKVHEYNRFVLAARDKFECRRYADALEYYDNALESFSNSSALEGKARCLLQLNRPAEALTVINSDKSGSHDDAYWQLKIDCYLKLEDYKNALATCDEIKNQSYSYQLSFLLRSKVYRNLGDLQRAKATLQDGFRYCLLNHRPKRDIVDELYDMHEEPIYSPPTR